MTVHIDPKKFTIDQEKKMILNKSAGLNLFVINS
jgi:hypothetical protein